MKKLNIVHFSTADNAGGSGRAAYRIHQSMLARGHASRMLTGQKVTMDSTVDTVHGGGVRRLADRVSDEIMRYLSIQYLWYPSIYRVLNHDWVKTADIFQLYNTHGGYFSQRIIPVLSRIAPIVWRLSDMWPMTGHCAYSGSCEKWMMGCGRCPDLETYPPLKRDTTGFHWKLKEKLYRKSQITVVAPSLWIEKLAKSSPLLGKFKVIRIPNGLDLEVFKPHAKQSAREILGIEPNVKIIMFCAQELDQNQRKGTSAFLEAMEQLRDIPDLNILAVGLGGDDWETRLKIPVIRPGYITDDRMMAIAYSAADLLVAPSKVDNLPNHVLEALACGTPSVAFDSGGMADAVRHMDTGVLIKPDDISELVSAVKKLLNDRQLTVRLGAAARKLAESEYNSEIQADRFEKLYMELVTHNQEALSYDQAR